MFRGDLARLLLELGFSKEPKSIYRIAKQIGGDRDRVRYWITQLTKENLLIETNGERGKVYSRNPESFHAINRDLLAIEVSASNDSLGSMWIVLSTRKIESTFFMVKQFP